VAVPEMNGMSRVAFNLHNALTRWEFSPFALLVLAVAIIIAAWYLRAEWTLSTRGRSWSMKRTISFLAGLVAVVIALQSPVSTFTMDCS
jgi:cytochrome c oxidase assembly factor CtaG